MCGIAGILSSSINLKDEKQKNILEQVSETLKMRGPDEGRSLPCKINISSSKVPASTI